MLLSSITCLVGLSVLFRTGSAQPDDDLGRWGPVFNIGVIPIHVILLPDAHVLSYGADASGKQGGGRLYAVWNTTSGQHELAENHVLMTQTADVNIFCSTLSMDITTGNILIMGGDDEENLGVNDVLEFNWKTHEIDHHPLGNMFHPRWYGTSVNLPDGRIFIAGGKAGVEQVSSSIPEIWSPGPNGGFKELPGADIPSMQFFGRKTWWYPHVYVNSKGEMVLVIADRRGNDVYRVDYEGDGAIQVVGTKPFETHKLGASIMYDVNKIAMIDEDGWIWSLDISNSYRPIFTQMVDIGPPRINGVMSMLPDGRVIIMGGSSEAGDDNGNRIEVAVKYFQIWDPETNDVWTGPEQDIPRLYHSSGLILPDGSVYSGGGGSPGPLKNSNGQVWYPGYFFDPITEGPAKRPLINTWPQNIQAGETIRITVDDTSVIEKVTVTKPGSMTHSRNCNSRWINLSFSVIDTQTIEVVTLDENTMIPGLWYINVLDLDGYPSEARLFGVNMVALGDPTPAPTVPPTAAPTAAPTSAPTTASPTKAPTASPTVATPSSPAPTPSPIAAGIPTDELLDSSDAEDPTSAAASKQSLAAMYAVVVSGIVSYMLVSI